TSEAGTRVVAEHPAALRAALDRHGIAYEQRAEQQLAVSLAPVDVGRLAVREQIVLTALGAADSGGLEDVFFALTGQTDPAAGPHDAEPVPAAIFSGAPDETRPRPPRLPRHPRHRHRDDRLPAGPARLRRSRRAAGPAGAARGGRRGGD